MQGIRSLIQGLIAAHKMPQRIEAADRLERGVEAYANDRVIDELERILETVSLTVNPYIIRGVISEAIKELKRQRRERLLIDVMKKDEEDGLYQDECPFTDDEPACSCKK